MQALKKAENAKQQQNGFPGDAASAQSKPLPALDETLSLTPMEPTAVPEVKVAEADDTIDLPASVQNFQVDTTDATPIPIPQQTKNIETNQLEPTPTVPDPVPQPVVQPQEASPPPAPEKASSTATENIAHDIPPKHGESTAQPTRLKIGAEQQQQAAREAEQKVAAEQLKAKSVFSAKQTPRKSRMLLMALLATTVFILLAAFGYLYWENTTNSPTKLITRPPMQILPADTMLPAKVEGTDSVATPPSTAPTPMTTPTSITDPASIIAPAQPTTQAPTDNVQAAPARKPSAAMLEESQAIKVRQSASTNQLNPALSSAYQAFIAGDMPTAQQQYEKVLRREPNSRDALLGMAAIAVNRKQATQASSYYLRLLELDPADPDAVAGLTSMQQGDTDQSESRLKKILTQNPNAGALLFVLGNLYASQSRWSEAQQTYFRAYGSAPDNADYAFNLAVSLDRLNQSKLALEYYQRAIALAKINQGNFNKVAIQNRIDELRATADN